MNKLHATKTSPPVGVTSSHLELEPCALPEQLLLPDAHTSHTTTFNCCAVGPKGDGGRPSKNFGPSGRIIKICGL